MLPLNTSSTHEAKKGKIMICFALTEEVSAYLKFARHKFV